MESSDFDFLKDPATRVQQPPAGSDFDFLKPTTQSQEKGDYRTQSGFGEYVTNFARNFAAAYLASESSIVDENSEFGRDIIKIRAISQVADKQGFEAMKLAGHDMVRIFGKMFSNIGEQVEAIKAAPGEAWQSAKADPLGFAGGLAKAFVMPIGDWAEATTGASLADDELRLLTPEERATRIKNVAATGVMMAVGIGTSKALATFDKSARVGAALAQSEEALGGVTSADLLVASSVTKKGAIAKHLMDGTIVGAASGTAQAAVAFANEDDQLKEMLVNGVIFAPLGIAFESVKFGEIARGVKGRMAVGEAARQTLHVRNIQNVMETSIMDLVGTVKGLETANELGEAFLVRAASLEPKAKMVVPKLNPETAAKVRDRIMGEVPHKRTVHLTEYHESDGTISVLAQDTKGDSWESTSMALVLENSEFFKRYGVLPNQIVDVQGSQHIIVGATKDPKIVRASTIGRDAKVIDLPVDLISRTATLAVDNINEVMAGFSVKTEFMRQVATYGAPIRTPMVKDTQNRLRVAETGKPFVGILFRQERGTSGNIAGTGRFYHSDPEMIKWYAEDAKLRGRATVRDVGPDHSLRVHRVTLDNPLVVPRGTFSGGQYSILPALKAIMTPEQMTQFGPELRLLKSAMDTRRKAGMGEAGYQHIDKIVAKIVKGMGHDGIIYNNGEVVDLTGKGVFPPNQKATIPVTNVGVAGRTAFLDKIHARLKDYMEQVIDPPSPVKRAQAYRDELNAQHDELLDIARGEADPVKRQQYRDELDKLTTELDRVDDLIMDLAVSAIGSHTRDNVEIKLNYYKTKLADMEAIDSAKRSAHDIADIEDYKTAISKLEQRLNSKTIDIPPEWKDRIPDPETNIETAFRKFATEHGFLDSEIPALRHEMLQRITDELVDADMADVDYEELADDLATAQREVDRLAKDLQKLDWAEAYSVGTENLREHYREAINKLAKLRRNMAVFGPSLKIGAELDATARLEYKQLQHANLMDSAKLSNAAIRAGFLLEDAGSGHFTLRDPETGTRMFTGTHKDAIEYVKKSGRANGVDLDADATIPPVFTGGIPVGNVPNPDGPHLMDFIGQGKMGSLADAANLAADFATPYRALFVSMDNMYKTEMFSKVFDRLQTAKRKTMAMMRDNFRKTDTIEKLMVKFTKREREVVGEYIETMSPDEIINKLMSRPMNKFEQATAQKFAADNVDLPKVLQYRRHLEKIHKDFEPGSQELMDEVGKLRLSMGMDKAHLDASEVIDVIQTQMSLDQASIGAITRLTRALQNGELSRVDFAAKHGVSMDMIHAANQIEKLYQDLAPVFGINPKQMLSNFMTHARLYTNGDMRKAMRHFSGDTQAKEFYAKMVRTGEITAYEKDPVRAIQRYIKAGYEAIHFNDEWQRARSELQTELNKLPLQARGQAEKIAERYMGDLRGWPGAGEAASQAAVDALNDKLKLNMDVSLKKDLVNVITTTVPAATQGMRVMAGIRDLASGLTLFYARFGLKRTQRMVTLGVKAMFGAGREALEAAGDINISTPLSLVDPIDENNAVLGGKLQRGKRVVDKVTHAMFRLSGQQDVYAMMHAGSYLESRELVSANLLKFSRDQMSWNKLRKKIRLDTYDAPVIKHFRDLVDNQQFEEATRFLATQTGYEQLGVFGLANHPYLWGTNVGRIAGQFGNWSMWARTNLVRMATRGTWAQRAGSMARLAVANALVMKAGEELGLEMGSWSIWNGLSFRGGPLVDVAESFMDASSGYKYAQEQGMRRLKRFLPYDPTTGTFNLRQVYLPGSFFVDDVVKGLSNIQDNGATPQSLLQLGGFRPQQSPQE